MANSHVIHAIYPPLASLKMVSRSCDNHMMCMPFPKALWHIKDFMVNDERFMQYSCGLITDIECIKGGVWMVSNAHHFLVYFWNNYQNSNKNQYNLHWKMVSKCWANFAHHFLIQNKGILGNLYGFWLISIGKMVSNAHHFLPPPSGCLIINVQTMWFSCNLLTNFILW